MKGFIGRNKKIILIIAAILVVLVLPAAMLINRLSFSSSKVCWTWGPDQKSTFPKDKLVQSFYPEKDGLRSIVVKPLLENDILDTAEAEFTFKDDQGATIFSKKVRHFKMENNKMFEILVPPDKFQKGKLYDLELTPLVEKKPGHTLGFWITDGNCYEGGLEVDGKKMDGADLAVIFGYSKKSLSADFGTLLGRMEQYKPLWLKNNGLLISLFVIYFAAVALLIVFLVWKE